MRTIANLKPCLLDDHPAYAPLAAEGAFVRDDAGAPCLEQFWDGWGAHLDFTRSGDRAWWQTNLQQQVLDVGLDVGWNDNNEYEIWDERARADGFGQPLPVARSRPLQALLMTRATYDAAGAPRAGRARLHHHARRPAGLQR